MKKVLIMLGLIVALFMTLTACGRVAEDEDEGVRFSSITSEEASSSCTAEVEAESASEAEPESETEASEDSEAELELDLEAEPEPEYSSATEEESVAETEDTEVNTKVTTAEANTRTKEETPEESSSSNESSTGATKEAPPITGDAYIVREGDTLSSIAQRAGISMSSILSYNEIEDPNQIYEGQVIYLTQREDEEETKTEEEAGNSEVAENETEGDDFEGAETETEGEGDDSSELTIEEMLQIEDYVKDPQSPLYAQIRWMHNSSDIILTYGDAEIGVQYNGGDGQVFLRTMENPYEVTVVATGDFCDAYSDPDLDGTIVVVYSSHVEVLEEVEYITYVAE